MKKRYIQDPKTLELVPAEEYQRAEAARYYVMPDLKPYRSMVDGSVVEGRRQHREHLKANNVVEVGNSFDKATPKPYEPPKGLKEQLIRAAHQHMR